MRDDEIFCRIDAGGRAGAVPDRAVARGGAGALRGGAAARSARRSVRSPSARLVAGGGRRRRRSTCRRSTAPRSTASPCARPICRGGRGAAGAADARTARRSPAAPRRRSPSPAGTATSIATGGPVPRGADAVVMVEHTNAAGEDAVDVHRASAPGRTSPMPDPTSPAARSLLRDGRSSARARSACWRRIGKARATVCAQAAGCRAVDRQRAGGAGRATAAGGGLRLQRTDHRRSARREQLRGARQPAVAR